MRIGILALQGAFIEHVNCLNKLGIETVEVRLPEDLNNISGIIIPGGESTAIGKLAHKYGLIESLKDFAKSKAVWGTCAGMILLAKKINDEKPWLDLMEISVQRNAFGRQVDSFTEPLKIEEIENNQEAFPAIFIRAPLILDCSKAVKKLSITKAGQVVAAQQGKILATAFHPELTKDLRLHKYFISLC